MSSSVIEVYKSKRELNIELLRILSMFFIVCNHFLGFGLSLQDYDTSDPNRFLLWFLRGICYTGTNLFILISAYFQCSGHFKSKSILLIICQVLFYSIVIYVLAVLLGLTEFSYKGFVVSVFPVMTSSYWFVTCYVGLYILAPFINKLISALTKFQHKTLIIILFIFFSVIPNLLYNSSWLNWGGSTGIVWFVFLYLVAAYIRHYIDVAKINSRAILSLLVVFMFLPLLSKIIIAHVTILLTGNVVGSSLFFMNNSIIIFPLSVLLLLGFMKINISSKWATKLITFFASSIFSVYLISEHSCLREVLWIYCTNLVLNKSLLIPIYVICISIVIMLICVLIDQFRKLVFTLSAKTGVPQIIDSFISRYTNKIYSDL